MCGVSMDNYQFYSELAEFKILDCKNLGTQLVTRVTVSYEVHFKYVTKMLPNCYSFPYQQDMNYWSEKAAFYLALYIEGLFIGGFKKET